MPILETTAQTIGLLIGVCTLGVFVWRISSYFWKKSKCFDSLKNSVRNTEEEIVEVKDQLIKDLKESKDTHIEIFKRLNEIEKQLSFIAGQMGYKKKE